MPGFTADIAVVGCGVSGATAALSATQNGATVAIFEEHPHVGEPSHCSGHVGILAFKKYAPEIPERIIENRIKGAVLHSPSGEKITLRRPQPVTWVLNRTELDRHLASLATSSGADLNLSSRVETFKRSSNGAFNLQVRGPTNTTVNCKLIIDAGGCGAPLSKYIPHHDENRMYVNSAQVVAEDLCDLDEELVELYFGQQYAPGFFAWIIPLRKGSAKIGVAAEGDANIRECFNRFVTKHPIVSSKLRKARFLTAPFYHPIPIGGARERSYVDGILAVGDAASHVKPTTGGGIVLSLICGRLAGRTAAQALQANDTSSKYLRSYERSWRKLLGFDLAAMTWIRKIFYRLPDPELNRMFTRLNKLGVGDALSQTADIDFQGRTLLALGREPRFMAGLLSVALLHASSFLYHDITQRLRKG